MRASERMTSPVEDEFDGKIDKEITMANLRDVFEEDEAKDFMMVMSHIQDIIDNPNSATGFHALTLAVKLAALRTKLGTAKQMYKTHPERTSIKIRRRKDILETIWVGLEENINTLKLIGKYQSDMEKQGMV